MKTTASAGDRRHKKLGRNSSGERKGKGKQQTSEQCSFQDELVARIVRGYGAVVV